jgi:chemotaxis protein histidine kinase CheA/ActR/RegA family two-component response regulator
MSMITSEQQELIDLIRNEVAELVISGMPGSQEFQVDGFQELSADDCCVLLESHRERLISIANAAELIGLVGLQRCCQKIADNFHFWLQQPDNFKGEQQSLLESWPVMILGYLQYICDPTHQAAAVDDLVLFMGDQDWVTPWLGDSAVGLRVQLLDVAGLIETLEGATDESDPVLIADETMISLRLDDDVRPELLEGLLLELPEQSEAFTQSIMDYQARGELSLLLVGQRVAHTIKGAANVVGVKGVANLMHYAEDVLQVIEKSDQNPPPVLTYFLLEVADCLAAMTDNLINQCEAPGDALSTLQRLIDCSGFLAKKEISTQNSGELAYSLESCLQITGEVFSAGLLTEETFFDQVGVDRIGDEQSVETVGDSISRDSTNLSSTSVSNEATESLNSHVVNGIRLDSERFSELQRFAGENVIAETLLQTQLQQLQTQLDSVMRYQHQVRNMADNLQLLVDVKNVFGQRYLQQAAGAEDASRLDPLELERYSEMHSFSHQLLEVVADAREETLQAQQGLLHIDGLVQEQHQRNRANHEILLRARLLPFSTISGRLQRCVRQAARLASKQVTLSIEDEQVLVDSAVLQQLADPLMHLLRNSVDHGIENPEQRKHMGKSVAGSIQLRLRERGGSLQITCIDDGAGIDRQRVLDKAIAQGLIEPDRAIDQFSDEQLQYCILQAGFSTRDQASQLSGRGIGLDAVVAQLQQCHGRLTLHNNPGVGCQFDLHLPQKMQSGYGLVVHEKNQSMVMLNRGVQQIIYLGAEDVEVLALQGGYLYQERIIPVQPLHQLLALVSQGDSLMATSGQPLVLLLIERADAGVQGVLVDQVHACRELVLKPLNRFSPQVPGVVGATILGDGSIAAVIDGAALLLEQELGQESGLESMRSSLVQSVSTVEESIPMARERPMALVVDDSLSVRRSLSQFVSDMGMDVRTARDGFEAIHVMEEQLPTVMLIDLEMPRMNGLELTAHVRAHQQTNQVPVIMITSRNTEKHRRLASEAGVNQFLPKPYSEDELALSIQTQMAS